MKITARDIQMLIEQRFGDKYTGSFEVKCGTTWMQAGVPRFDWYGLQNTWKTFTTVGIEIKVSRADFLSDKKWPQYLDYCHEFYFAAPYGVVDAAELPPGVGLYVASKNGTSLLTKRKAAHRAPDEHKILQVLRYLIMWRMSKITTCEQLVTDIRRKRVMKPEIEAGIQAAITKRVGNLRNENQILYNDNRCLQETISQLENIKEMAEELGLKTSGFGTHRNRMILENKLCALPVQVMDDIELLAKAGGRLNGWMQSIKKRVPEINGEG